MSLRHPPSSSDGLIGGAFVVVGFVVLIVIATVDLISSRWSTSSPPSGTTQGKGGGSFTPLKKDEPTSTPDIVKEDPNPLNTQHPVVLKAPNPTAVQPQLSYPLIDVPIPDLDAEKGAEVSLHQEQDSKQAEQPTDDDHEIPLVASSAPESSQEWVSLSKPDESQQPNDIQPEPLPTSSSTHEAPSHQQETPLEFSSSTLIDAPNNNLHESVTTIASSTTSTSSPPPSTPEPDSHFTPVHTLPESTTEFGSTSEILKPRASIPSLYDHNRPGVGSSSSTSDLSTTKKNKRSGGSFIKKSGTLINKVFKNKDTNNAENQPPAESVEQGLDASIDMKKKLTSPSRVSLGSIRSISGSIKKKIGKNTGKDAIIVTAQDEESPLVNSTSSKMGSEDVEPSLLKTMFKVRKPSK